AFLGPVAGRRGFARAEEQRALVAQEQAVPRRDVDAVDEPVEAQAEEHEGEGREGQGSVKLAAAVRWFRGGRDVERPRGRRGRLVVRRRLRGAAAATRRVRGHIFVIVFVTHGSHPFRRWRRRARAAGHVARLRARARRRQRRVELFLFL